MKKNTQENLSRMKDCVVEFKLKKSGFWLSE